MNFFPTEFLLNYFDKKCQNREVKDQNLPIRKYVNFSPVNKFVKLRYIHWTSLSLATLLAGLSGLYLERAVLIGAGVILSYIFCRKSVKFARMQGRTENSKMIHAVTENLIEFSGLTAAFFFTEAWAAVLALGTVGFSQAFYSNLRNIFSPNEQVFGRKERTAVLGVSFMGTFFNEYVLLYGLVVVGGLALFDSMRQIYVSGGK
jgi:hypothetical protein